MDRRGFLKGLGFGSATIGGVGIVDLIHDRNESIEVSASHIVPKGGDKAAICLTYGDVRDGYNFPLRPRGIATDGTAILFVWPSERGQARGYVKPVDEVETPLDRIVFRLRQGRPEPPYYLRWRRGEYYLYTPPGALVKRAASYAKEADSLLDSDADAYFASMCHALSDLRFAIILNLTQVGGGQSVMDELAELDNAVREAGLNVSQFWERYTDLLTRTRV